MTLPNLFHLVASSKSTPDGNVGTNEPLEGDEANPPIWPNDEENRVVVLSPDMDPQFLQETLEKYQDPQETVTYIDSKTRSSQTISTFRPHRHFTRQRTALLFAPGTYECEFQVGYYTQVLGLGASAADVQFAGTKRGPYCPAYNRDDHNGTSLDTFWRSAENFATAEMLWAVSQAAPLRRVHCYGDLKLSDGTAYASGGHLANARIDGQLAFGSQQQFCSRSVQMSTITSATSNTAKEKKTRKQHEMNVEIATDNLAHPTEQHISNTDPCAWSSVFVDCLNPPNSDLEEGITVDPAPKVTVEKPYLVLSPDQRYALHVPQPRLRPEGSDQPLGPVLTSDQDDVRDFTRVYVARAKLDATDGPSDATTIDKDVARKINKALQQGKDVVLSPGIYHLQETIRMTKPNQVLLGIGMATLVAPTDGCPCIHVTGGPGVRVAGIMLEASRIPEQRTKVASLLEWGTKGSTTGPRSDPTNPGVLSDVFARVGGSSLDRLVSTDVMVRIHSDHVLGDNIWLWRADHVELGKHELPNFPPLSYHQIVEGEVPVATGLEVNGDYVTIHGLAVEHTTEHQVVWNGDHGNVQFYQCELPYDVSTDFGLKNYMGYKVGENVEHHSLGGAGVYSNFRDHNVLVKTAIEHPHAFKTPNQITNPFTVHLDNQGLIMTVVTDGQQNGGGPALPQKGPSRFDLKKG